MLSLIVCTDLNGAIGKDNQLLASIPADMKFFKDITINKVCVMGSKTFDSILVMNGKPLTNRISMVITSRADEYYDAYPDYLLVRFTDDVERIKEIINEIKGTDVEEEIVVCGGSNIYNQFIDEVEVAYVTTILHEFKDCDAFFPVDKLHNDFETVENESRICDVTGYGFNVTKYIRKGL